VQAVALLQISKAVFLLATVRHADGQVTLMYVQSRMYVPGRLNLVHTHTSRISSCPWVDR
jgi:hypothetical protein